MALYTKTVNIENSSEVKKEVIDEKEHIALTDVNKTASLALHLDQSTVKKKSDQQIEQAQKELYADHIVKEEVVIGPEVLQQPNANAIVEGTTEGTLPKKTTRSKVCSEVVMDKNHSFLTVSPPYTCLVCNEQWQEKDKMIEHMQKHTKEQLFCCSFCNKEFKYKCSLKKHLVYYCKSKILKRDKFKSKKSLKVQTKSVASESFPYKCGICKKGYSLNDRFKMHMQGHKKFSCSICEKKFISKRSLVCHLLTHEERSFNCDICGAKSKSPNICLLCNKQSQEKNKIIEHIQTHAEEQPLCCSLCNKIFKYKCTLKKHLLHYCKSTPLERDKFISMLYSKRNSPLNTHMRRHNDEKPFCCDICQKKFGVKDYLRRHLQTHIKETPYSCHICGNRFKTRQALEVHDIKVHTKNRSYNCWVCNKVYSQRGELKNHLKTHCGEKPGWHLAEDCRKK